MKMYVDELPKENELFIAKDKPPLDFPKTTKESRVAQGKGIEKISLTPQEFADYTKQVRKEVCELIWGGFVGLNNINGNYEYKKFEDDFRKFLDQIEKGESECQKN